MGLFLISCEKEIVEAEAQDAQQRLAFDPNQANTQSATFAEGFNSPSKTSYSANNVYFSSGIWNLNDAVTGTAANDRKWGTQSVRIRNSGKLSMTFDVSNVEYITFSHAKYGTDAASTWGLWVSQNSGATWTQLGATWTTNTTYLKPENVMIHLTGAVRFEIRKINSVARLNIDDFTIYSIETPSRDNNMTMGNPDNATTSSGNPNHYLMQKTQYTSSYNNSRGIPNWVSWHLSSAWKGATPRQNSWASDNSLPVGFLKITTGNYTNSGYDRGHLCPSDDRDGSIADNDTTFLMTNIMPQAPICNQQTWEQLEAYCRTLLTQNYELYIIAGGYGNGGQNSSNVFNNSILSGAIAVPSHVWKVIVAIPVGSNDLNRVNPATRVIAVDMPNTQTVNAQTWGYYRTTVDGIEAASGFNILSALSSSLQTSLESVVDTGPTI